MNSQQPPVDAPPPSLGAWRLMLVILAAMILLSLYANVQRWRRDKVESVTFTAAPSPSVSPSPSPR